MPLFESPGGSGVLEKNPLKSEQSLPHIRVCVYVQVIPQRACSCSLLSDLTQDPGGAAWHGYGDKGGSSRWKACPNRCALCLPFSPCQVCVVTVLKAFPFK